MYRDGKLQEAKTVWQLLDDVTIEEVWLKDKIAEMRYESGVAAGAGAGADWGSVQSQLNRQGAIVRELEARQAAAQFGRVAAAEAVLGVGGGGGGQQQQQHYGADVLAARVAALDALWRELWDAAAERERRLVDALELQQFLADADDANGWMFDVFRAVSCEDCGEDEASARAALHKHDELLASLEAAARTPLLSEASLATAARNAVARESAAKIGRRFEELCELAALRRQKLVDAISLFQLMHDAGRLDAWIADKERFLANLAPSSVAEIEELEVMRHRFEGFERGDMHASAAKVALLNSTAAALIAAEHPGSHEINSRLREINERWEEVKAVVDAKRDEIQSTFGVQTFHIECDETITWIQDKVRIVQSTEDLGRDLTGVMTMQRRLSGIERDLGAIQAKLDQLDAEADELESAHPHEADSIRQKIGQISSVWYELKDILKRREESMGEAAVLQKFLRDLDHFSSWLTKTQTLVASEDTPESLSAAEQMLNKHQAIKEEIDRYAPDYSQMRDYGQRVIRDADTTDPQYVFLRERLNALDDGWNELDQMWHQKQNMLSEAMHLQMFERDARVTESLLNNQEYYLQKAAPAPRSLEDAEGCIRKHDDFSTSLSASEDKIQSVWQFAQRLCHENHYASDKIMDKAHAIVERFSRNKKGAADIQDMLRDSLKYFQFVQDCDDLKEWLEEKTVQAQADTYRDSHNIHSKYLRHQAFSAEIAANRERLEALKDSGHVLLLDEGGEGGGGGGAAAAAAAASESAIERKVAELDQMWAVLETTTREKGERLFDANRGALYEQCISDVDRFVTDLERQFAVVGGGDGGGDGGGGEMTTVTTVTADDVIGLAESLDHVPGDLTRANIMLTRQALIESEFELKKQQVEQLKEQAEKLKAIEPLRSEQIDAQRQAIEHKFLAMQGPLLATKQRLSLQKRLHQFVRDVEDERLWVAEKMAVAGSCDFGDSLATVWMLERKNESLAKEVDTHCLLGQLGAEASALAAEVPGRAGEFNAKLSALDDAWTRLLGALAHRRQCLADSGRLHQFLSDVSEAEIWLGEQELMLMGGGGGVGGGEDDCGRDEATTSAYMRKFAGVQLAVREFAANVAEFSSRATAAAGSERAFAAASQLRQLYESLVEFSEERGRALHARNRLHMLRREVDEFGHWVSDKELVADSPEMGADFEHVSMLCERFKAFDYETRLQADEKVAGILDLCGGFIREGHRERDVIAGWSELVAQRHQDLLELVRTRGELLQTSFELHKFFHDSREVLALIAERVNALPDHLGKDARAVFALQRKHANFERDLASSVSALVASIQAQALQLIDLYAGPKADQIREHERNVLAAWDDLRHLVSRRKRDLQDCADMHRFFNMARDLTIWVENIVRQMKTSGRPARDVSGIDLLMNNHQALRADIDAREENFAICINLGKDLLSSSRKHPRSLEIKEKCVQLCLLRDRQASEWDERWEHLQLELEVYQFARDAAVAEAWLVTQESYLQTTDELGENLDQVENLIRKHEAFEKSIVAQEDRFNALKNLTTLEKREQQPGESAAAASASATVVMKLNHYLDEFRTWDERELEAGGPVARQRQRAAAATAATAATTTPPTPPTTTSPPEEQKLTTTATAATRLPPPVRVGFLAKKHIWETPTLKASNRSWERVYAVLKRQTDPADGGGAALPRCVLELYKDQKQYLNARKGPEDIWNLVGSSSAEQAYDYHKRPHVLRLTMDNGAVYLFSAHNLAEMNEWIDTINQCAHEAKTGVILPAPPAAALKGQTISSAAAAGQATNTANTNTNTQQIADARSRSLPSHDRTGAADKRKIATKKEKKPGQATSSGFFSIRKK